MSPSADSLDLQGRVCLITGCSGGIGKEAARRLAARGATVLAVCRDAARGEAAVAELRGPGGDRDVRLLLADLSSQAEVRRLAGEVRGRHARIHALVNNAGAIFRERGVTVDGIERTFALNHLAPFLLTQLLLEPLRAAAPSRIVTVASDAHRVARLDFDDLGNERRYNWGMAYAQSKLANVLFTYELARRLQGSGVTANCLHPGAIMTGIWREAPALVRGLVRLGAPMMVSPARGADRIVQVAASPEIDGVSGAYFAKGRPARSSPASYDTAAAARLWEISERLTAS